MIPFLTDSLYYAIGYIHKKNKDFKPILHEIHIS